MQTFTIPADRANQNLVLRGTGPALHVKTSKPSQMFIVTKSRTQTIKMNGATNIRFAS